MPSLSLCLIAKNEAEMLPDCLASVQGVVDQIVVCDTGSSDQTVALAKEAGAVVVNHMWTEDFAAARNAALAAATGTHVLILDADERLMPGAREAILAAIADLSLDLGMLPLHNAVALDADPEVVRSGAARRGEPIDLPRLFRRDPGLHWQGVVHESPTDWLKAKPRTIRRVEAHILHLGAVPSLREDRGKRDRNLGLLRRRAEQEPGNPQVWAYLAGELLELGEVQQAKEALENGWQAALDLPEGPRPDLVQLLTLRAHTQLGDGAYAQTLETFDQGQSWGVRHPNLLLQGAIALRQMKPPRLVRAAQLLEACLAWDGSLSQAPIPGAMGWLAAQHLGEVRLAMDEQDEAQAAFERAHSEQPENEAAALGLAEICLRRGESAQALRAVEPLMGLERPDSWMIAAAACSGLGQPTDMQPLVHRAQQLVEKGFVSRERAGWLLELVSEADLYAGKPHPGPGVAGRLGALASRLPAVEETPVEPEGAGHMALNLVKSGHPQLLEPFFEPRAEALLPGIGERVRQALAFEGIELQDDGEPDFVFIGGAGRSGTTLFRAMLGAHKGLYCGPELKLVPTICTLREQWISTMGADLREAGVGEEVLDSAVRAFVERLLLGSAPEGEELRVAEKTPHNLLHMALLGRLFPRARFVHMVRDGRAVAASLVRQRWVEPATGKPIWYCENLEGASRYWVEMIATIRQQAANVPGRYLEVRYEDLVRKPEQSMRRVLAFLGEPWDPAVLSHESSDLRLSASESSSAAVAQALNTGATERWRTELSSADLESFDHRIQAMLEELDYVP